MESVNIPDLKLKEELGDSYVATVNKAVFNNKTIVVKKYKIYFELEKDVIKEYSKLINVNHENILNFYDTSLRIENHPCLLMEYADCGTLHEQIHGAHTYTTSTAINWMYQCAKGLAFLHERCIVHFNINSNNLFLTNNFQQLKIGDLANNRVYIMRSIQEKISKRFSQRGSYIYVVNLYDVQNFGIVLLEVLTRQKPLRKCDFQTHFTNFPEDPSLEYIKSLIKYCGSFGNKWPTMKEVATIIAFHTADITLGEIIGAGAFGVVHKAKLLDISFAVKKFFTDDNEVKKSIEKELKFLSLPSHPNIVDMLCTKMSPDSKIMIVMEFADCGTLYDYIHQKGDYSELTALEWMRQLFSGLKYLHAMEPRPIIHRDIKTKNLLLTDNYKVLKIADFGTVTEMASLMTQNYVGTAEYMAPEVLEGYHYSEKSDVYSFGIVFWEVMSKKKPFYLMANRTPLVIMNLVSKGERPPIKDAVCSEDIRRIIECCWNENPEKRPDLHDVGKKIKLNLMKLNPDLDLF